jgi:hypothetical protein
MDAMTLLDADLVHTWFGLLADPDQPATSELLLVPTAQEARVFGAGEADLLAAVLDEPSPDRPGTATEPPTELPARMLRSYLHALAAGIAGTRQMLADAGQHADDEPAFGDTGALALVTGLNAAAAALHGQIVAPSRRSVEEVRGLEPTAAESASLAGVAAAELVVNGAGLHEVAATAAAAAIGGRRIGLPTESVERDEYRAAVLVGAVLRALEIATREPEPPAEPAECGAMPGENLGEPFEAEITFTMGLASDEIRSLSADLGQLATDVAIWPGNSWPRFHLHTNRPAEVIGQIYAHGTPFDLQITNRD